LIGIDAVNINSSQTYTGQSSNVKPNQTPTSPVNIDSRVTTPELAQKRDELINLVEENTDKSKYELKNDVVNVKYDKDAEQAANIDAKKQQVRVTTVNQHYVESQKNAADAYMMSATGNELYQDDSPSLTERYNSALTSTLKSQVPDGVIPKPKDILNLPSNDVSTLPIKGVESSPQQLNNYSQVQSQPVNSLLHLAV
jgi:hypothetical protein